ncbi:hypothetical protein [Ornithinimicrobium pratense]|uniref:Uncharacterized protein n=1 Tax=Ornithinimicrobium pratense TaxID=2593973 RepID=A0A5J6V2H9_9MICO|nr:hypothetical protein [Ornithinimicrobium pratense]QFG67342.1 hypothetical protein FY030_00130 [Ornithinimicrobium pratense]
MTVASRSWKESTPPIIRSPSAKWSEYGQTPGKVSRQEGGLFSPRTQKLVVGTRDCTRLVDGELKQAELVQHALDDLESDIVSVLCLVEADWPLIGGDFHTCDVYVTWPNKLAARISRPGPLVEPRIDAIQRRLTAAFPAANATYDVEGPVVPR